MAKAKVFEGRVRITSTLTDEAIKKALAFKPETLKVVDNDEVIFAVSTSEVSAFSRYGVILKDGKAVGDFGSKLSTDDKYILEGILANLATVEAQVGAIEFPTVELVEVE